MSARTPRYYSCNRCGYRGTNLTHVCDGELLVQQPATTNTLTVTSSRSTRREAKPDDVDLASELAPQLVGEFARLLGRVVTVAKEPVSPYGHEAVTTVQRCRVCRNEIKATVCGYKDASELASKLAASISHAYLIHECPPAEQTLFSFTTDQLEELHQQLERDFTRIGDRILEIERLMGRRSR